MHRATPSGGVTRRRWMRAFSSSSSRSPSTAQAADRLRRVLTNGTGLGVLRHADAGYETATETAPRAGLGLFE